MQNPDVSADTNTVSELIIGESNTEYGVFEISEADQQTGDVDTDWHRVDLEFGRTYLFFIGIDGTTPGAAPRFEFFDRFGNLETVFDSEGSTHFRYTARYTGRHFVSAFQGGLLNGTTYSVDAHEIRDDTRGQGPTIALVDGYSKFDEIEVAGDLDVFDFEVFPERSYRFIVVGQDGNETLTNPSLNIFRNGSLVASGSNFISFDAASRETLQVEVGGNNGDVGAYSVIGLVADEAGQDINTTSQLSFDSEGIASTEGYISEFLDFDWHRVELNAGDIVRVNLRAVGLEFLATPNLIVRDPNLTVLSGQGVRTPSSDASVEFLFQVETTGTHYVVARTTIDSFNGAYEVSASRIRTPATPNFLFGRGETTRLLLDEGANIPLVELLDLEGLNPFAYEVYSSVPLLRDGNIFSPNNTYGIIAENIGLWSIDASLVTEPDDLLIRAVVSSEWSEWHKFNVTPAFVADGVQSGTAWEGDDPITFRFVGLRPDDYGENEFGDFQAININSDVGRVFTGIFNDFNQVTDRQLLPAESGDVADINIFSVSDLGRPFLSFLPAGGRGGDIIINTSSFDNDTLSPTQVNQLLRATGPALGLSFNDLSVQDSILGSVPHPNGLIADTYGNEDWLALQELYGSSLRNPDIQFSTLRNFVLDDSRSLTTIPIDARNIIVGDEVINEDFTIDLRDGARSFARDGAVTSEVIVAYGAQVVNGVGGDGEDFIFGNGLENVLQGGDGDDFLTGFENADVLIGGGGNDTYVHFFGDGTDFVSDESGIDTLCIHGEGPFEAIDLVDDFLFTRDGRFLEVSLTLDGGPQEGLIRIDTGLNNNDLVESLELWHDGALMERISLFNLYNELGEGQSSRFDLLATSDNFGRLVTAV